MSNLSELDMTAADNNGAPPNGAPEGMLPGKVNDVIREMMSALAKFYQDQRGSLSSTGSSNAYVLTTNQSHAALSDLPILVFDANFENTGSATLNVDTLGAKNIYKAGGLQPLQSGDIKSGQMVVVIYNPTDDHFEMLNNVRPSAPKGHLYGLGMSSDTDADHDITVVVGEAVDDGDVDLMVLATDITKQLDSGWSVGDDAGGLDTGSVAADTTYHVFLIKRSDTGVVDVLFSASATSPTMPSNYDRKRRIGSIITDTSANVWPFEQYGDLFYLVGDTDEHDDMFSGNSEQSWQLDTIPQCPTGIVVSPLLQIFLDNGDDDGLRLGIGNGGGLQTTEMSSISYFTYDTMQIVTPPGAVWTNTSAQIYAVVDSEGGAIDDIDVYLRGWFDRRGRDA